MYLDPKELMMRNPNKVGSLGFRKGFGCSVGFTDSEALMSCAAVLVEGIPPWIESHRKLFLKADLWAVFRFRV